MPRLSCLVAFAALCATPALACDCIRLVPGGPHFEADLDRIAAFYPVAAEGVIEANGAYSWRFKPSHEFRGPKQASYPVELISDCSLDPEELKALIGKPVFLLLSGGPDRYEASRCVNLQGAAVEAGIRKRIKASCTSR